MKSRLEDRGIFSYLAAAGFLFPVVTVWYAASIFLFPKLQEIWDQAGVSLTGFRMAIKYSCGLSQHGLWLLICCAAGFFLLEKYAKTWPRLRGVWLGVAVFFVNSTLFILLTVLFASALIAAPALAHPR
jgi:hypothetical protein